MVGVERVVRGDDLEQLPARGAHHVTVEQAAQVQIAVLFEPLAQRGRIAVVGLAQPSDRVEPASARGGSECVEHLPLNASGR